MLLRVTECNGIIKRGFEKMSQEKVDLHKQEKKNMKGTVRKRKLSNVLSAILLLALIAGIGVWIGFSAYRSYKASKTSTIEEVAVDVSALDEFNTTLGMEYTTD